MSRQMTPAQNPLATADRHAVPSSVFSKAEWTQLAQALVDQDLVLLPQADKADGRALEAELDAGEQSHRKASGLALVQHWESLGFVLGKDDIVRLCAQDTVTHAWLHKQITPALKARVGGHVRMRPMYPNFPKQVMDMDEAELLFNAITHYQGDLMGVRVVPYTESKARRALAKSENQQRALRLVDTTQLPQILGDVARMNTVWTPAQAALAKLAMPLLLSWGQFGSSTNLPQRENQAQLAGAWLALLGSEQGRARLAACGTGATTWPAARVSTTDLLRAAVAYSGGDPSLASSSDKVRMGKLSRAQRRVMMQALEQAVSETSDPLADLHGQRQAWLRLAEQLHVGEWKAMPRAREAIDGLRNQPPPVSWRGKLDALLSKPATAARVSHVTQLFGGNPGFAARALGRVLRWAQGYEAGVLAGFGAVADRVDTPVLLALEATLQADAEAGEVARARVMLPKGVAAWRYRVEPSERVLDSAVCEQGAEVCRRALTARFAQLAPLGKVFVEPGLEDVIVPKGLRSASGSVGVVARGSKLPIGQEAKIVRLFLWWKDTDEGCVDVDLSAVGVDENFQHTETCNYHGLRGDGLTHSGDLTSAPNGAAEFVDVQLAKLNKKTRYVVLAANVFHGPAFNALPECFVGWQERKSAGGQRGEIMEVKTVVDKFQVTAPSKGFVAAAFDIKERKLVWLDLPMNTRSGHSIYDSQDNVRAAVEDFALYAASQPKIGHLVDLHVAARGGVVVDAAEDADTVFCLAPRTATGAQTVIAASQPQTVASTLMVGPKVAAETAQAQAAIEAQDNPLDQVKVGGRALVPRR